MSRHTKQEQAESLECLRGWLPKGSTLYCILRRVNREGTSRVIQFVKIHAEDGQPLYLGYHISRALGMTYVSDMNAVRVQGGGMDMGMHVIESLSVRLYGEPHALKRIWL